MEKTGPTAKEKDEMLELAYRNKPIQILLLSCREDTKI